MAEAVRSTLFRLVSAALFAVVATTACEPRREVASKDPLDRGYELIDQGHPAEAAAYLEGLSRSDSRPQVRVAWASALAAQGGIKVDSYWGFVVGFKAPLLNLDRLESTAVLSKVRKLLVQLDGKVDFDRESEIGRLGAALGVFELYRQRIESIPIVVPENRAPIERALDVLRGNPKSGGRLYRAILGFVLLRTDLDEGFAAWAAFENSLRQLDLEHPANEKNKSILCAIDVDSFGRWTTTLARRVDELGADLSVAFPSKESEMVGASQSVHQVLAPMQVKTGWSCR